MSSKSCSIKKQKQSAKPKLTIIQKHIFERLEKCINRKQTEKSMKGTTSHNQNSCANSYFTTVKNSSNNLFTIDKEEEYLHQIKVPSKNNHNPRKSMVDSCISEIKEANDEEIQISEWESKVQQLIHNKIQSIVESIVDRSLKKYFNSEREIFSCLLRQTEQQMLHKTASIEKGYDYILQTYDSFLKIVQVLKNKTPKSNRHFKGKEWESAIASNGEELKRVQQKICLISKEMDELKTFSKSLHFPEAKIEPIILNYEEDQEFNREELKVVVSTYNQNFRQIDQKLKELYSYLS